MADKVMKMPVNYEAEQAMLGSIMMDTNVANDFTTLLREDDLRCNSTSKSSLQSTILFRITSLSTL